MSFITINGNALDYNVLMGCINGSPGSRGQNKVKDGILIKILSTWPELDGERDDVARIDENSKEARITRAMELDSIEQGVMAETFLEAIKPATTLTARYRLFRRAAEIIKISKWWGKQTTENLAGFAGEVDGAESISDPE